MSNSEILTLENLKSMRPGEIIASGVTRNSPEGVYMTDNDYGRKMIWIAKRGAIHDWTIYIHWESNGFDFVLSQGDKVTNKENIKKLVPCDDEALGMYRY